MVNARGRVFFNSGQEVRDPLNPRVNCELGKTALNNSALLCANGADA